MDELSGEVTGQIVQLDDKTIGLIAAGEVVERPAQVVKELLENSLDAGATRIEVIIDRGGFDLISVRDDGRGIVADQLKLAVTRHATSKLSDAADLSAIYTLGFRGEALASIGAVSILKVASRPQGNEGRSITVADGEVKEIEAEGLAFGTLIEVRNLFANQPARLAFQRRPATETAKVVDVVVSHALCTPKVSFRLTVDGRSILDTPKTDEIGERLYDLLGGSSERLVELSASETDSEAPGEERWRGWISPPDINRGRADDVHIIINGRPVASQPFLQAIKRGYHTRLMVGRHPVAVLMLDLPADEVDVNVHPTKREVRLRHSWRVLERLERAIKHTLKQVPTGEAASADFPLGAVGSGKRWPTKTKNPKTAPSGRTPSESMPKWAKTAENVANTPSQQRDAEHDASADRFSTTDPLQTPNPTIQTKFYQGGVSATDTSPKPRPISTSPLAQQPLPGSPARPISPPLSSGERELHRYAMDGEPTSPLEEPVCDDVVTEIPQMEPLAQFADSYILAQGDDSLYVVDQHALHERIRYERLREKMENWQPQPLIQPLSLALDPARSALVMGFTERLEGLGFSFSLEGGQMSLTSVPLMLAGDSRLGGFFTDLVDELAISGEDGPLTIAERLADEIAFMKSCRGAVKANQKLSLAEMRRLLADMSSIENPWACVHGRPTVMKLDVGTLDDHFGRHG